MSRLRFQCLHQSVVEPVDKENYAKDNVPPAVINTEVSTIYANSFEDALKCMPESARRTLVQIVLIG
jgi:hypothetical protein